MRLFVGGGPLSQTLALEAKRRLTPRLFSQMGSTEAATIAVTPVEGPDDLRWHRLLPERDVQIVDEQDRELPAGQAGLVRIRPLDGAPGYLDDPEANRSFFRDGYFYPGDLGVIGPEGRLALHGRAAEVINIMGRKIAAGPIEAVLRDRFNVSGACILSALDASGETVVQIVIESRRRIPPAELEAVLQTIKSADHVHVHYVEALPRNHMGKIQRNILREQLGMPCKKMGEGHLDPTADPSSIAKGR